MAYRLPSAEGALQALHDGRDTRRALKRVEEYLLQLNEALTYTVNRPRQEEQNIPAVTAEVLALLSGLSLQANEGEAGTALSLLRGGVTVSTALVPGVREERLEAIRREALDMAWPVGSLFLATGEDGAPPAVGEWAAVDAPVEGWHAFERTA